MDSSLPAYRWVCLVCRHGSGARRIAIQQSNGPPASVKNTKAASHAVDASGAHIFGNHIHYVEDCFFRDVVLTS